MLRILWNGRAGLQSNQNKLDVISNNIANVDTNGYKKLDVAFEDIFYDKLDKRLGFPITAEGQDRDKIISGSGSKAVNIVRNSSQGNIVETGRELDIAIEGAGYFRLKGGDNKYYYTRDGAFNIDGNGNIVHSSGLKLDLESYTSGSQLKSPIRIDTAGNVYSEEKLVGKIYVYDYVSKDDMIASGNNLFTVNDESGNSVKQLGIGQFKLRQGFIEKSNVDLAKELTDMLITQRAYELNSKSIRAADEMWQISNNLRNK
jgi:flagellar basal-body rod protein FlgG